MLCRHVIALVASWASRRRRSLTRASKLKERAVLIKVEGSQEPSHVIFPTVSPSQCLGVDVVCCSRRRLLIRPCGRCSRRISLAGCGFIILANTSRCGSLLDIAFGKLELNGVEDALYMLTVSCRIICNLGTLRANI